MPIDKDINAGYMGSPGMGFSSSDRFDNYMDRGLLSLPSQINSMPEFDGRETYVNEINNPNSLTNYLIKNNQQQQKWKDSGGKAAYPMLVDPKEEPSWFNITPSWVEAGVDPSDWRVIQQIMGAGGNPDDYIETAGLGSDIYNYFDDLLDFEGMKEQIPFTVDELLDPLPFFEAPYFAPPLDEDGDEIANLDNNDLYHLMRNGYTLEEAQEILNEQIGDGSFEMAELSGPQINFMNSPMGTPDFFSSYQDYKDMVDSYEEKGFWPFKSGQESATDPEVIEYIKERYGTLPWSTVI